MTTLASFKRATRVGDRFEIARQDYRPELVGSIRTATAVTTGHLHYDLNWADCPASGLMEWPKARDVTAVTDNEITYRLSGPAGRKGDFYVTLRRLDRAPLA